MTRNERKVIENEVRKCARVMYGVMVRADKEKGKNAKNDREWEIVVEESKEALRTAKRIATNLGFGGIELINLRCEGRDEAIEEYGKEAIDKIDIYRY